MRLPFPMALTFDLIGLVVADMPASLAFYRCLGLGLPPEADGQPHVELALPGGLRLAWDTVATIRSFDPDWTPPSGDPRVSLAFRCESPAEVDRTFAAQPGHDHRRRRIRAAGSSSGLGE